MIALYVVIVRHEKVFGPLGQDQDELKRRSQEKSEEIQEDSCETQPPPQTQESWYFKDCSIFFKSELDNNFQNNCT